MGSDALLQSAFRELKLNKRKEVLTMFSRSILPLIEKQERFLGILTSVTVVEELS